MSGWSTFLSGPCQEWSLSESAWKSGRYQLPLGGTRLWKARLWIALSLWTYEQGISVNHWSLRHSSNWHVEVPHVCHGVAIPHRNNPRCGSSTAHRNQWLLEITVGQDSSTHGSSGTSMTSSSISQPHLSTRGYRTPNISKGNRITCGDHLLTAGCRTCLLLLFLFFNGFGRLHWTTIVKIWCLICVNWIC